MEVVQALLAGRADLRAKSEVSAAHARAQERKRKRRIDGSPAESMACSTFETGAKPGRAKNRQAASRSAEEAQAALLRKLGETAREEIEREG